MKSFLLASVAAAAIFTAGAASASTAIIDGIGVADYGTVNPSLFPDIPQPTPVSVSGTANPGNAVVEIRFGQDAPAQNQDNTGWNPWGNSWPLADTTHQWINIGSNGASATYDLTGTGLAIVWGSPNDANTVTFNGPGGPIGSVTVDNLIAAFGANAIQNTDAPGYMFEFTTPTPFQSVTFSTNGSAFEFAIAGAPEPSTWAMMGLGFAALAFAGYRGAPLRDRLSSATKPT